MIKESLLLSKTQQQKYHVIVSMFIFIFFFLFIPFVEARIGSQDEANIFNNKTTLSLFHYSNNSISEINLFDTEESSIVGGHVVKSSEKKYPFIVSIMEIGYWSNKPLHSCAGTLIASDVVLTAAHCVNYNANRIVVDIGNKFDNDSAVEESFRIITGIYIHPDFNEKFFSFDVALLKLNRKSTNRHFSLLKKEGNDRSSLNAGDIIKIIGWGSTLNNAKSSYPDLHETQVNILSKNDCHNFYGQYFSEETMICAYGINGKDACKGDSGGPALYTDSNNGGTTIYQVGIVSWGDGCGSENPGVYTNLESPIIENFINEQMCSSLLPESCIDGIFYVEEQNTAGSNDSNEIIKIIGSTDNFS